ncbi:hypothetical protein DL95DRAFT_398574 [Leptodontidium sp. 2 PMI_412]|nr:hypothetical protein DL95DRAFT_398574 [Leptodontidium sp. 2 PMI_412]
MIAQHRARISGTRRRTLGTPSIPSTITPHLHPSPPLPYLPNHLSPPPSETGRHRNHLPVPVSLETSSFKSDDSRSATTATGCKGTRRPICEICASTGIYRISIYTCTLGQTLSTPVLQQRICLRYRGSMMMMSKRLWRLFRSKGGSERCIKRGRQLRT